jgi:hypothetical protein
MKLKRLVCDHCKRDALRLFRFEITAPDGTAASKEVCPNCLLKCMSDATRAGVASFAVMYTQKRAPKKKAAVENGVVTKFKARAR